MGFSLTKPDNLWWLIYSVIFGYAGSILTIALIFYFGTGYVEGNLYNAGLWMRILLLLAALITCGVVSSFFIWKDKATRDTDQDLWSFIVVFSLVNMSVFIFPIAHLIKSLIVDDVSDNVLTAAGESSTQTSTKIGLVIILLSALGGPGLMIFTGIFVGIFLLFIHSGGQSSPTAEKINPDKMDVVRTLMHQLLGGKGKK